MVDVLGGFEDAIDIAANMANLENYRISYLPKKIDPMEELIKDLTGGAKVSILENELGESYQLYKEINNILEMDEVQMRMPYFLKSTNFLKSKAQKLYLILAGLFIAALVSCNLIFQKFLVGLLSAYIHTFEISVGIIPYPITFLVTDIISEIYGRKKPTK